MTKSSKATADVSPVSNSAADTAAASRPKRVRTGCLTCRERHLKCDEGLPECGNCQKSGRQCKRGVRLNFIDTTVKGPPITPPSEDWDVTFHDESREIASEYKGGAQRYVTLPNRSNNVKEERGFSYQAPLIDAPMLSHQQLPNTQPPSQFPANNVDMFQTSLNLNDGTRDPHHRHGSTVSDSTFSSNTIGASSVTYTNGDQTMTPPSEAKEVLTDPEELLYMQVFIEEVAIWMDSMDPYKHFSRLLPFDSLGEPMLLNAFLACGARHLNLVNPAYEDQKARDYYSTSSTLLLKQMQNPYRDTVIVATTAVILNVYEIMTERALQRMNHIAGARALIKECGWNAKSAGIGNACFWLNVGMELLSCLHFNWQVAWNPDDWGVDMDFSTGQELGREEIWTHRMVWIVAHIANFRASLIVRPGDPPQDHVRLQNRYDEWKRWKDWLDAWEASVPRTMQPLGRLASFQNPSKSLFPEVWMVKRAAIIARMFYHTGIGLLCESNPLAPANPQVQQDMQTWQLSNAKELCGIVAHVKDRGVASVAIRSLHSVAFCLVDRAEQSEVFAIFDKIKKETGWRIDFIYEDLKKKWGLDKAAEAQLGPYGGSSGGSTAGSRSGSFSSPSGSSGSSLPPAPPMKMPPAGIVNPTFAKADFARPDNPYEGYYVAPIQHPSVPHSGPGAFPHF